MRLDFFQNRYLSMRVVTKGVNQIIARVIRHRWVIILIAIHTVLLIWSSLRNGFGWTEVGLLPAGILDWQYNGFDVFRVNPPLVRMWATWPLAFYGVEIPFIGTSPDPRDRAEWSVGKAMIEQYGTHCYVWLGVARMMCLPFAWIGMIIAYRWSHEVFGQAAGLGALLLWTFSPMLIGYGSLMSGDAQGASMGLLTLYLFRNWLRVPTLANSLLLGLVTGLTVLTKSSWLILFGLLPLLWITIRAIQFQLRVHRLNFRSLRIETFYACVAVIIAISAINVAYEFQGSFRQLGSYEFMSKALAGSEGWQENNWSSNRFKNSLLGSIPVPFPEDFVTGIDLQKWDFDRERWSYLRGEWRDHGWWYYYLYGLLIKVPVGTQIIFAVALIGSLRFRDWRGPWIDELLLLTPLVFILFAASSETGLNRHLRYVLPIFPFGIVLASRAFKLWNSSISLHRLTMVTACSWLIISSLFMFPHSASYFNEFIGGPTNAWRHMNASNISWGQDLRFVEQWAKDHPERRPLFIKCYLHIVPPNMIGIPSTGTVPSMPTRVIEDLRVEGRFLPGWYIIDQETMLRR